MEKGTETNTSYIVYLRVKATLAKDGTSFADYPNEPDIVEKVDKQVAPNKNTTRELLSDSSRYRVYYPKNSMAQLFADIEAVMI